MTRERAAAGLPAAARQAEKRAPPLGIADEVNLTDSEELAKADSTLKTYKRFITGKRGWLEWTAAQAVPPLSLNVNAASIVANYDFYRTEKLTLGEDLGGQLIAAISAYYDAQHRVREGQASGGGAGERDVGHVGQPLQVLLASLASWFWKTARTCLCWCWHPQI